MSASISGRGKPRKTNNYGQDLSSNAMSTGGGQMAMPPMQPNMQQNAQYVLPSVPMPAYSVQQFNHTAGNGQANPVMYVPEGVRMQSEQPSHIANMQGVPQGMANTATQNSTWTGQQPQHMPQHGGMVPTHNAPRGVPTQRQFVPQPQMGYGFAPQQQPTFWQSQQQGMYGPYPTDPATYQAQAQMFAAQQYQQQHQQYQQQFQQQHPMQPQQSQSGGPPMTMQAPASLQQGGGGGGGAVGGPAPGGVPMGGAQPMQQQTQQQQPMHGGAPPASAAQPVYSGSTHVPMSTGPIPSFNQAMPQQQPQQRPPVAPVAPKKKNILAIVNPETNETVNQNAVEASKKEEDAPKAEKEEVKGADETDSAAPEVKKQFATQILEQTTKSDQPAPVPTPVVVAPAKKERSLLFSADQMKQLGLDGKVPHAAAPPVVIAAAPAVEQSKASEYLPEPLPAPAYPNNYKEKQTTPEITLPEMTTSNNDDQRDDSHLTAEVPATPTNDEPASSSSEKNTSNDSAICVQTPVTPPPPTESATFVDVEEEKTVVVEDEKREEEKKTEEEDKQEEEVEETPSAAVEPLSKKLDQLVIVESASQEEAESEPSTPAPVTPSVSETAATLAEEEEDAEKLEAARLEELQRKKEELEAEIAQNETDPDQVNTEKGWYNREYLYNVRDYEKLFNVTTCPLTPSELIGFGICRSLVNNEPKRKQDGQGGFMPGWARGAGGGRGGGGDRKPYAGRQSEQNHRGGGGGGGRHGSNKKLPPSIRPSIERRVETNVQLHKAEKAWKPEKVTEADESEETKKKLLLKTIRALFNKITPTTKDKLIDEFLAHKVYESPSLSDVISIIFDKAVEEPKFCPLYSNMCHTQVQEELKLNNNVSLFRNAILIRAQETFTTKNLDDYVKEKQEEIEAETDEKKKKEKQIELLEAQSKFRRRKFGNITFIGQLYLQQLISVRIILFCVVDLLKSVTEKPENLDGYEADEESVDCAVRLLETIGKRLQEESARASMEQKKAAEAAKPGVKTIQRHGQAQPQQQQRQQQQPFPIDMTFQTLEGAIPIVSSRIKFMIMNLVELRKNNWMPRKTADAGPKKLDEIKKDMQKEQMENQNAQMAYERKHSRQDGHGMGGGRGPMGGGGRHGDNPKRMVIQRNSQDSRGTKDERMSQAHKSATLATRAAPPKKASLSSVTNDGSSLGGSKKNKWSGGASGGSENSKKEDRAAAIQSARFMGAGQRSSSSASMKGAEDEGASASGTATQVNSEDEREQNEAREKQEKDVTKRLQCDIGDYHTGEINLEECRTEVFNVVGAEKFQKPSHATVFKCLMAAAVKKAESTGNADEQNVVLAKFGHVLSFCLLKLHEEKDKARDEMLKGVAESCREVVEQEQWEDNQRIWNFYAEVLINAHLPTEGLFEGAHPSLGDFKDAFLNAAKDTRKPYTLFVLVLKRLAEMHYKRDKDSYMEIMSWVLDEDCKLIMKHVDGEKLDNALKETEMEFADNLFKIMRQEGH